MSFWTKLFGKGDSSSSAKNESVSSNVGGKSRIVACSSCGHKNPLPLTTPAFGTSLICSQCKASLIRVSDANQRPYIPPREVALFFGYEGCSLLHPRCPSCRAINYSVIVPERGYSVSFYWNKEQENPDAAFVVDVNCSHCQKPFVIEWDEDPR